MTERFEARLAGFPHPDGAYTGEVTVEDGQTWYRIDAPDGEFDTQDYPVDVIVLGGVVHTEQQVYAPSGTLLLVVGEYPRYLYRQGGFDA